MNYTIDNLKTNEEKQSGTFYKLLALLGDRNTFELKNEDLWLYLRKIPPVRIDGVHYNRLFITVYGIVDGDARCAPTIKFLYEIIPDGNIYPYYYKNEIIGIEIRTLTLDDGRITEVWDLLLPALTDLSGVVLKSISEQLAL